MAINSAIYATFQGQQLYIRTTRNILWTNPWLVWTPKPSGHVKKDLGINLTQKCLERWYAAVGVDGGRNATSANQLSSFTSVRIW